LYPSGALLFPGLWPFEPARRSYRPTMESPRRSWLVPACLFLLYTVWGSTYLAQRIAISSFAPLQMAGVRFVIAGSLLYGFLRLRGAPAPGRAGWRAVAVTAVPLIVTGMGAAAFGVQRVPSGLASLLFGSVPLWVSLFERLWGGRLRRTELLGLALGFAGVLIVSLRGGLAGDPAGALILVGAAASYALGCVSTRRLPIPEGALGTAAQMLVGGAILLVASAATGEPVVMPTQEAALAMVYLVGLGSLAGYTALGYLLRNARPALATSYAFVNPLVALALGATLAGERFAPADFVGLALVLCAVAMVALGGRSSARARDEAAPRRTELRSA
jgi:drug/metabolite transporter (DMT)-like permease